VLFHKEVEAHREAFLSRMQEAAPLLQQLALEREQNEEKRVKKAEEEVSLRVCVCVKSM